MPNDTIKQVLHWLGEEIHSLKDEINVRTETLDSLEKLTYELENFEDQSDYKSKFEQLSIDFDREKERLLKLHNHYRKVEGECEILRSKIKNWHDWFDSNKDIYEKLFSAAPPPNISIEDEEVPPKKTFTKKKKTKKK